MSRRLPLGNTLACLAFAALAALQPSTARAVIYSSNFDPVGFFGTATFDVDDSCLGFSGFVSNNSDPCTVTWLTADVTLQSGSNSVSFSYQPTFLPDSGAVNSIFVQGGELAGVDTATIGPMIVTGSGDSELDGPWWLAYQFSIAEPGEFGLGTVRLFHGFCNLEGEFFCVRDDVPTDVAQVEDFTRVTAVPEPGSLALVLGALAACSIARRRRGAR